MFVLGNFVGAAATVINILLTIMFWLIFIRAMISWVNPDPFNPIVQFLVRATEPVLEPIRRLMPPSTFDLSPLIAGLVIWFLRLFVVSTLYELAAKLH